MAVAVVALAPEAIGAQDAYGLPWQARYAILAVLVLHAVWAFRFASRLVGVELANNALHVSGSQGDAAIPLAAVAEVRENRWLRGHPITVRFNQPTPYGDRIVFVPIMTGQWSHFAHHPVVDQIRSAATLAGARLVTPPAA